LAIYRRGVGEVPPAALEHPPLRAEVPVPVRWYGFATAEEAARAREKLGRATREEELAFAQDAYHRGRRGEMAEVSLGTWSRVDWDAADAANTLHGDGVQAALDQLSDEQLVAEAVAAGGAYWAALGNLEAALLYGYGTSRGDRDRPDRFGSRHRDCLVALERRGVAADDVAACYAAGEAEHREWCEDADQLTLPAADPEGPNRNTGRVVGCAAAARRLIERFCSPPGARPGTPTPPTGREDKR
jgi:hypothetical protein